MFQNLSNFRSLHRWLLCYMISSRRRRAPTPDQPVHLLLCIADHFEPHNGHVSDTVASSRVQRWLEDYPRLFADFRDADNRPPQHTFFYPMEQYAPAHIDALAELRAAGFGDIEIHLHHDHDTSASLRQRLLEYKHILASRHDLLSRHRGTNAIAYGFVHGDWALANSAPGCGVNDEIAILRQTGCYADFTLTSAPHSSQTRKINSIYYAFGDPGRPRSHDWGPDVGAVPPSPDALMLIQGPLVLNWQSRKWRFFPRIENGCIQGNQSPTMQRLDLWLQARVQIPTRPDWFFVKLHTHGAPETNQRILLGQPMLDFHRALHDRAAANPNFHYHYVTAREMYNLAAAAEAGWTGPVNAARDFALVQSTRPEHIVVR